MKNIKTLCRSNKFKAAPIWTYKFELPDCSNSLKTNQGYFDYITGTDR